VGETKRRRKKKKLNKKVLGFCLFEKFSSEFVYEKSNLDIIDDDETNGEKTFLNVKFISCSPHYIDD
jgi:hypothetical protein